MIYSDDRLPSIVLESRKRDFPAVFGADQSCRLTGVTPDFDVGFREIEENANLAAGGTEPHIDV